MNKDELLEKSYAQEAIAAITTERVEQVMASDDELSQYIGDALMTLPDSEGEVSKACDARAKELLRLFRNGDDVAFVAALRAAVTSDVVESERDRAEDRVYNWTRDDWRWFEERGRLAA